MSSQDASVQSRALSEEEFLQQMGLDMTNEADLQVYGCMKREAIRGLQHLYTRGGAEPSEQAFRAQILDVYQNASPETRAVYDRGASTTGGVMMDNWVIRFMLWQAIHQPNGR